MIGQLRQRVTFQRRVVANVGGVAQETWPNLPPVRVAAAVRGSMGRQEDVIDGTVQTQTSRAYTVRTRYRADLTTQDRCVYHHPAGDRMLQILGITDEDERRAWLVIEGLEVRA